MEGKATNFAKQNSFARAAAVASYQPLGVGL